MRRRSKNLTKALRRSKYLLAIVVLFGAGAVASGALGMVSLAGGDTTTEATDSTPAGDTTTDASTTTDAAATSDPATTTDAASTPATTTSATIAATPTIASDKADYAPGSTVHLTGGGWQPGEAVRIFTNDTIGNTWNQTDNVTADANGNIADDVFLPNYFISDYNVTATGAQSGTATTSFTDAVNYALVGKDNQSHNLANSKETEEDLGSITSGSNLAATCPTGLTAKASGLGGSQSTSYAISYVSGFGDNASLSPKTTISPSSGTFNGNGSTCTSLTISTTGLGAATYHGELQMTNTGGSTGNPDFYYFKFTVIQTQQATAISAVAGSGTYASTATLTATLKTGPTPLSGKTISFTLGGTAVGSAATDSAGVASLSGVSLSGFNAGISNSAVGAAFAGDTGFSSSTGSGNLSVAQAPSLTTITCPASVAYDGAAKTPCSAAVTGAGGLNQSASVSYSNNTAAGTATANASYAGDTNHSGSSDSKTFTIAKASSTTTVSCPSGVAYDGSAKTPCTATVTGAGGLSQALTVNYSNNTGAGTAGASASFAGDANHNGSGDSKTFTIAKANQTISFTDAPFSGTFDQTFQVHPTASSGLPITLSGTAGVCSVTPNALQLGVFDVKMLSGTGTCTLTASQADNGNYNAAGDVSRNVAAAKAAQTITFAALADKTFGDADFSVSASASSSLAVSFAASGDCSIGGATVHIAGAGNCTVTASQSGNNNYSAATDVARSFAIAKAGSSTSVSCNAGPFTYTGSPHTPCTASVSGIGGLNQSLSVDYTSNTNAGTATASATYGGDANHTGSSDSKTFTIDKADSTVTVSCPDSRTFTGEAIEPCTASVSGVGGLNQPLSVDYTHNTNAGTASASASYGGDGNHTASTGSGSFKIDKASSSVALTCADGPFVYSGSPHTPCTANVTGAGGLNTPLDVSYSNNVAAGTAHAGASYDGDANHTGSSDSKTFTIDKAASAVSVTCPSDPQTYNGAPIAPCSASVTGAGGLNQNLTVDYGNNKDAGTATASAAYAGDDNHNGSDNSATFTIAKAPSTVTVSCDPGPFTYTGAAQRPCSARATGAGGLDKDLHVPYSHNLNAGTATASASYGGDDNHDGSSDSATFTIQKAASAVAVTCPASETYSGDPIKPCSAKATGAGGLEQELDVSYTDNVSAGTAAASASFGGDDNHTASSGSGSFKIDKASSSVALTCADGPFVYSGSPHTPCTAKVTGAGSLNTPLDVSYTNNVAAGTAHAGASYDGDANHTGSSDSKTFTIDKADSTVTVSCPDSRTFTGEAIEPCSAAATGAGGLNQSLAVHYADNTNAGTAAASASYGGDDNHTASSGSGSFKIDKASSSVALTCPDGPLVYTGSPHTPCTAKATGAGSLDTPLDVSYTNNVT